MRPRISMRGSVRPSVRRSVRPSVGWSVTLSSKTRLINIFEQIIATGGLLGSLDASLHLYKTVYPSIGLSVHWSVCHASVNVFQQVKERESQEESHVVTSSHNHFIIMRTHRWPYGPCLQQPPTLCKYFNFAANKFLSRGMNFVTYTL